MPIDPHTSVAMWEIVRSENFLDGPAETWVYGFNSYLSQEARACPRRAVIGRGTLWTRDKSPRRGSSVLSEK